MRTQHTHADGALSPEAWTDLEESRAFLLDELSGLPPGVRHATSREVAQRVLDTMSSWASGHARRRLAKNVRKWAFELTRLGTLLSLHLAEARLIEMDGETQRLREVVISANSMPEAKIFAPFGDLVRTALIDHSEYARRQGVEIRFHPQLTFDRLLVEVELQAMRRAIGNLVHNAIKYSWHRADGVYSPKGSDSHEKANPTPAPTVVNRPLLQIQRFAGPVEIHDRKRG